MRKEKGGKRGKKKMSERQKEGETEGEQRRVQRRVHKRLRKLAKKNRCVRRIQRVTPQPREPGSVQGLCQETTIVEFVKEHSELYDKEHARFHDRQKRGALWAEISAELKLQPFDVRSWFESQRAHYGKLQFGQAPREMTKRQWWVYQQMGFLETHIRWNRASRSSGFEASD